LRRDRDAEGAFREALLLEPGDAFTAGQLADLLVRAAREREARPLAELAVRVRPDAWAHQRLARIAERLGDRQAAATHYRHALAAERDPKRREGLQRRLGADRYRQAVAAKRAGRLEEALTAFRMIAAAEPSSRYGKAAQAQSTALERLLAKGKK
jgi:tetratricopeptide (TPR) repeat protein